MAQTSSDAGPDEAATLRRLGFVAAATVHLVSPGHDDREAVSKVVEFGNDDHARIYRGALAAQLAHQRGGRVSLLCVIGLPNAQQVDVYSASGTTHDLLFQNGRFVYLVGVDYGPAATEPLTMRQLLKAAQALRRRVA